MNKKVLIITYYWPPSGGSGVQRWLKFVKYLPQFGWLPYVFTPANPSFPIQDKSLLKNLPGELSVIHFPIWEPYDLFYKLSKLTGGKEKPKATDFVSTGKRSFFQRVSSWVRGNVFIPDPKIFWIRPSVNFLKTYLKQNQIDVIITSGPPHSMHLIGYRLKKKCPHLKWIADMRDPWSEWDLIHTFSLTALARNLHKKMERNVLQRADRVITISPYHVERFSELGGRKVDLITNGFDEDDFKGLTNIFTDKFTIRHLGIADELRDPRPFMQALRNLCSENPGMLENTLVEFIGSVNSAFMTWVNNDPILRKITFFKSHVDHDQLIPIYGATDVLLLVLANTVIAPGNLPGKFFEYMASGKPIFAVGPVEGDAGKVIRQTQAGFIADRDDIAAMQGRLREFYERWIRRESWQSTSTQQFSRKELTRQLTTILDELK